MTATESNIPDISRNFSYQADAGAADIGFCTSSLRLPICSVKASGIVIVDTVLDIG